MKVSLRKFKYQDIVYKYSRKCNAFETIYDNDLHLFIIWSKARSKEKEIISELNRNFQVVECFEVFWTGAKIDDNFHRIYDVAPTGGEAGKRKEVGDEAFIVIVLKDLNPQYQYRFDASGRLKIVNSKVVDKKKLFRQWAGGSYMIHSTDNLKEFFNNAILLFGKDKTLQFIEQAPSNKQAPSLLHSNLIGSNGWGSHEELFDSLNLTTEYVVLRGAENIESAVKKLSGDIDILCSNIGEFTAVANARNIWNSKNFFHVTIAGKEVLFDIRYINDNYFDRLWQINIIKNRVLDKGGIYIPRVDDYFFSHLYHSFIHKPYFLDKHIIRLSELSREIGIENFENNEDNVIHLLRGYLLSNGYHATIPKDEQVYLNIRFLSKLKKVNLISLYLRVFNVKLKNVPKRTLLKTKELIKRNKVLLPIVLSIKNKYIKDKTK